MGPMTEAEKRDALAAELYTRAARRGVMAGYPASEVTAWEFVPYEMKDEIKAVINDVLELTKEATNDSAPNVAPGPDGLRNGEPTVKTE